MIKTGLEVGGVGGGGGGVQFFSALFNHIDINEILDIHKYLMKKYD